MSASAFDAVNKRPPHAASSDALQVYSTSFTGTGTAAALCLPTAGLGIPGTGCFITWVADADCYIHFGATSTLAAATSAAFLLPANTPTDFFHQPNADDFFSVVQKTTAGTLKRYRSNS